MTIWIKLFFVLTPFFALTMFITLTEGHDRQHRRRLALSVSWAAAIICLVLFFVGRQVFAIFGITLDSFRVGAGILLLLSGISLGQGRAGTGGGVTEGDITVVPLAIPIVVGPATTGTLLVMGAELNTWHGKIAGSLALLAAVASVGGILFSATALQRMLGLRGIAILSRLTGLIVAALASQMIMTGLCNFLTVSV